MDHIPGDEDELMIENEDEARAAAERFLASTSELDLVVTTITPYPTCWVVGYSTVRFLETGIATYAVAGGPVIINRTTGESRFAASALPAEEQLDKA